MKEILNFISKDECDYIINIIKQNHHKSKVVGESAESVYDSSRTSSTSNLNRQDSVINNIHKKISNYLNIPIEKGEDLQGQLYKPGQFFRPHQDGFGSSSYKRHCLSSGNRTHTLMIYLNDNFEGGETNFPNQNKFVKPETGKAVIWENIDAESNILNEALHEGTDVTSGEKYIITSWWRENEWNGTEDLRLFNEGKNYSDYTQIPKFTEKGFKISKVPENIWGVIKDTYSLIKEKKQEEIFEGKENIIGGENNIIPLDIVPNIRKLIHNQLKPFHEDFSGAKLEATALYGIRSYSNENTLVMHRDRVKTHHISSIILIDKDLNKKEDWALNFIDHNNNEHKLYLEPGEMVFYESATCLHGRIEPFKGNYYNNMFVHYKLI